MMNAAVETASVTRGASGETELARERKILTGLNLKVTQWVIVGKERYRVVIIDYEAGTIDARQKLKDGTLTQTLFTLLPSAIDDILS